MADQENTTQNADTPAAAVERPERPERPERSERPERRSGPRPERRGPGGKYAPRPKVCQFCVEKTKKIDYKAPEQLRRFVSDRGKIRPRRQTGTCARHQRHLAIAIKRARHLALLPFVGTQAR